VGNLENLNLAVPDGLALVHLLNRNGFEPPTFEPVKMSDRVK
jgi:hypothetical protein